MSVVEQVWSSYTTKDLLESAQHLACSPVEASQSHRDGGLASAQGPGRQARLVWLRLWRLLEI